MTITRWKIGVGIVAVVLLAAGVAGMRWLVSDPLQETAEAVNLEDEWANTIRKIGIEPVFPPEEDLTVGDVLAVVVKDNKPDADTDDVKITAQLRSPKRAIKLAHIDVRDALIETYALLPLLIARTSWRWPRRWSPRWRPMARRRPPCQPSTTRCRLPDKR